MTGKGEGAVPWEGESQLPSGKRRLPSDHPGREWWWGGGAAPALPLETGKLHARCPQSSQPPPHAVTGDKSWAEHCPKPGQRQEHKSQTLKFKASLASQSSQVGPRPSLSHWASPIRPQRVSVPPRHRCGSRLGGTRKTVQHSGWGPLRLRKGKRGWPCLRDIYLGKHRPHHLSYSST